MTRNSAAAVTRLLAAVRGGDRQALDEILPHVYDELREIARAQFRKRGGHDPMLQATALVHEAWFKLVRGGEVPANDRSHFLAIAATAMRQVLVDQARAAMSKKRGGEWRQVTLFTAADTYELSPEDLIALDHALQSLDPRQRQIVECRYFAGMDDLEIAEVLGISDRTVRREWVKARAWLHAALYPDSPSDSTTSD